MRALIGCAAATLAAALAACDPPSRLIDRLDDPEPQLVRLGCGEEYRVYEKSRPRRLIVASSLAQEYDRRPCPGFETLYKLERLQRVALRHLAGAGRKGCSTSRERMVATAEASFQYRCEGDPEPHEATGRKRHGRDAG